MNPEAKHQEKRIHKLFSELLSAFNDIAWAQEVYQADDLDFQEHYSTLKDKFELIATQMYPISLAYVESKNIPRFLKEFIDTIDPYYKNRKELFSSYINDNGDQYSRLAEDYWKYLSAFPIFSENEENEKLLQLTGLSYLEYILESTAVIMKTMNKVPTKESDVYAAVKIVCRSVFPRIMEPSTPFLKTCTHYIPDILIPSLFCAVEYKYSATEKELNITMDEILIDVKGYGGHPDFKLFYAVFYVAAGTVTRSRFNEIWKEKEFPENWKGIMVEGEQSQGNPTPVKSKKSTTKRKNAKGKKR